jgi:hypothetical protein
VKKSFITLTPEVENDHRRDENDAPGSHGDVDGDGGDADEGNERQTLKRRRQFLVDDENVVGESIDDSPDGKRLEKVDGTLEKVGQHFGVEILPRPRTDGLAQQVGAAR